MGFEDRIRQMETRVIKVQEITMKAKADIYVNFEKIQHDYRDQINSMKADKARLDDAMTDCAFWSAEYAKSNKKSMKEIEGIKAEMLGQMEVLND